MACRAAAPRANARLVRLLDSAPPKAASVRLQGPGQNPVRGMGGGLTPARASSSTLEMKKTDIPLRLMRDRAFGFGSDESDLLRLLAELRAMARP